MNWASGEFIRPMCGGGLREGDRIRPGTRGGGLAHQGAQLRLAARQARHDGADGQLQQSGDFLVGEILDVKERERDAEGFIDALQRGHDHTGIEFVHDAGGDVREFARGLVEVVMREPGLVAVAPEILAIERGEKPAPGLGGVAQLPAFRRPQEKSLLRQVRRQVLAPGQTEREAVERLVVLFDQAVHHQRTHKDKNAPERSYSLLVGGFSMSSVEAGSSKFKAQEKFKFKSSQGTGNGDVHRHGGTPPGLKPGALSFTLVSPGPGE